MATSNTGAKNVAEFAAEKNVALYSAECAKLLDVADPLARYREQFCFPSVPQAHATAEPKQYRYFCGNSLGLQHVGVEDAVQAETKKWREQAVEGHFTQPNPWFEIDDVLRAPMAKIVGATENEVAVMNSLTANMHFLLAAFFKPNGKRTKILCEQDPFPSDMHALVSQLNHHGLNPEAHLLQVKPDDGPRFTTQHIIQSIEDNADTIAVVWLAGVHFLTGQAFDLAAIAAVAHKHNIPFGVDLAHAAGNLELKLHDWNVDFACWCTYKYLNGGPGNIGGLFVHQRCFDADPKATEPVDGALYPATLRGWWGHQRSNRFHLGPEFDPSPGAAQFQMSNPCVLSIMSLAPSVRLCAEIGMDKLRAKSLLLTGYLEMLIKEKLAHALEVVSPLDEASRGCQLSVRILPGKTKSQVAESGTYENGTDVESDALMVQRQLKDAGVICDNRPPDFLRLSPVPTYNSFEDVFVLVDTLVSLFVAA